VRRRRKVSNKLQESVRWWKGEERGFSRHHVAAVGKRGRRDLEIQRRRGVCITTATADGVRKEEERERGTQNPISAEKWKEDLSTVGLEVL